MTWPVRAASYNASTSATLRRPSRPSQAGRLRSASAATKSSTTRRCGVASATTAVDAAYSARSLVRGRRAPAIERSTDEGDLGPYRIYQSRYASTEGWFAEGAIVTWDALLSSALNAAYAFLACAGLPVVRTIPLMLW